MPRQYPNYIVSIIILYTTLTFMTMLLTSDGIATELHDIFLSLLAKAPSDYSVAFITTAALDRGDDNPSWLEHYRQELRHLGITNIEDIDLRKFTHQTLQEKLETKDIFFVNGGNTYYLMKYVTESGFGQILPQLLEQNKLYIGVSAGSVIMGHDIALASWSPNDEDVNDGYISDTTGLALVPFAIWPHFKTSDEIVIKENVSYPVLALTNTQAVLWKDNHYSVVGEGLERIYKHD